MLRIFLFFVLAVSLYATEDDFNRAEAYFQNAEYTDAFEIYSTIVEQEESPKAAYKLGWLYEQGQGVEADPKKAILWYKKAAKWDLSESNKEKVYETIYSNLDPLDNQDATDTLVQLANGKFGLRAYYPNYAVVSYTDQIPRGEVKYQADGDHPNGVEYINTETKYQISLRADYITNWFGVTQVWTGAYTQTSYWQIFIESAPFRETNYKPELFVTFPFYHKLDAIGMKGVAFGYKHSSNGQPVDENATEEYPGGPKEGSRSRSWNRLFARAYFQWENLFAELTLWHRIAENISTNDNPDLEEFYGPGSIELGYIHKKLLTRLTLRPSFVKGHITGELEMSYPVPLSDNVFFYLQAFSGIDTEGNIGGYGQSLIDYNVKVNQIGFGLSISR